MGELSRSAIFESRPHRGGACRHPLGRAVDRRLQLKSQRSLVVVRWLAFVFVCLFAFVFSLCCCCSLLFCFAFCFCFAFFFGSVLSLTSVLFVLSVLSACFFLCAFCCRRWRFRLPVLALSRFFVVSLCALVVVLFCSVLCCQTGPSGRWPCCPGACASGPACFWSCCAAIVSSLLWSLLWLLFCPGPTPASWSCLLAKVLLFASLWLLFLVLKFWLFCGN